MARIINKTERETRPIKWIREQVKDGLLTVDHSFQRNYVWAMKHKIRLIESVLVGTPIPEIFIWEGDTDIDSGETELSIVDGQQRIGAIISYINGEFGLSKRSLEFIEADYAEKSFKDLSPAQKKHIWNYPFRINIIKSDVDREEIVDVFIRINSTGFTLNPQELRHARFEGLFLKLAEEIRRFKFWDKYSIFSETDTVRMRDIQFISSILIFFRMGIESETTQSNINRMYDLYEEEYEEYDEDKRLFSDLIKLVVKVIDKNKEVKNFLSVKTHLYTLFIVLYGYLSQDKKLLKKHMRNYRKFSRAYENFIAADKDPETPEEKALNEYWEGVFEGTQKKMNRVKRFNVLQKWMDGDLTHWAN